MWICPLDWCFITARKFRNSCTTCPKAWHEFFVDGKELHVLAGKDAAGDYVVVDHASEYDKIELVVYSMMGAWDVLGFILLSMYIGGVFCPARCGAHYLAVHSRSQGRRFGCFAD